MKRIWIRILFCVASCILFGLGLQTREALCFGQSRIGPWGRRSIPSSTVMDESCGADTAKIGVSLQYARADHSHGSLFAYNRFAACATEFLVANSYTCPPWLGAAVASGTISPAGAASHPGIVIFKSSTTTKSGYQFTMNVGAFLIGGGEQTEFIFRVITTTNTTIRMGFFDIITEIAPVDGIWVEIAGTTLSGKTSAGSSSSTTGTTYTINTTDYYHVKIVVSLDAHQANFYLYNGAGTLLWADFLTTNIPSAETGHGIIATNSGTTSVNLLYMDWMNLTNNKELAR